jgi:predicted transcriptional regulator
MKYRGASVEDLQLPEVVSVHTTDLISSAYKTMVSREFSQVPVVNTSRRIVGFLGKEEVEVLVQKKAIDLNKDIVEQHCVSLIVEGGVAVFNQLLTMHYCSSCSKT